MDHKPFECNKVSLKFRSYPKNVREKLMLLRKLIFEVSLTDSRIGEIEETLKWNEPAYVPDKKSGSTVRIDWKKKTPNSYYLYVSCKTTLVQTFRQKYGDTLEFSGKRALVFSMADKVQKRAVKDCILDAFTYYLD